VGKCYYYYLGVLPFIFQPKYIPFFARSQLAFLAFRVKCSLYTMTCTFRGNCALRSAGNVNPWNYPESLSHHSKLRKSRAILPLTKQENYSSWDELWNHLKLAKVSCNSSSLINTREFPNIERFCQTNLIQAKISFFYLKQEDSSSWEDRLRTN